MAVAGFTVARTSQDDTLVSSLEVEPRLLGALLRDATILSCTLRSDFAPSMRRLLNFDRLWSRARDEASASLSLYGERLSRSLPSTCPVLLDDLLKGKEADDLVRLLRPPLE